MGFEVSPNASFSKRGTAHSWDAERVGQALIQAFVTLDLLPKVRVPRGPGSNWPNTMVEWADQLAQAELEISERKEREQSANRTKILPSAAEITQMEMAFDWLRELRIQDSGMAVVVTFWALRTARGRSIKRLCVEKGWSPRTFWRKRAKALEVLAARLNTWGVPVF